jgi:hypothetical protein
VLTFTDEDGETFRMVAEAPHQDVNVYYGQPLPSFEAQDLGGGAYFLHFPWDSTDGEQLATLEGRCVSVDQLMRFDLGGDVGWGIFELLFGGDGYPRYPNWAPMDMTPFAQRATRQPRG